jgi:hypothetical protein
MDDTQGVDDAVHAPTSTPSASLGRLASSALAVLGVSTLAVAQPLFDLLGREATFFVAHRSSGSSIVWFALVWFFIPPLVVLTVVGGVTLIDRRAGHVALAASVGILGAVALAQSIPGYNDWPTWAAVVLVLVSAPLVAWLFHTRDMLSDFLKWIGCLAPAALLLLVFFTPVNELVFAGNVAASGKGAAADHQVVVVVFDELSLAAIVTPEHEIDAVRAPNFSRLSEMSTWYRQATTVAPRTQWAVPALLSGIMPDIATIPIASRYPQNLFTTLAPTHRLQVDEIVTRLCPSTLCETTPGETSGSLYKDATIVYMHSALPVDLANRWLPPISNRWAGFGEDAPTTVIQQPAEGGDPSVLDATDVVFDWLPGDLETDHVARWNRFVDGLVDSDLPTVAYMHSGLPHVPYSYLSDGRLYNGNGLDGLDFSTELWADDQQLVDVAVHRYLLQVEYSDTLLGRLLDELESLGRLDNTLLVVTSDHGTSLRAGTNRRIPLESTLSDVAQVPLFIKYPGQWEGEIDDRPVQLIDVFPTIANVMGITLADAVDGQVLLSDDWKSHARAMINVKSDFERGLNLDRAIALLNGVVPAGTRAAEAYGIREARSLVGTAVRSAALGPESTIEVEPVQTEFYSNVQLRNGFVPARFLAKVYGADRGAHMVIALNGVVAGSGIVTELQRSDGIAVMLDPDVFTNGANDITAYELEDGRLRPAAITTRPDYVLEFDVQGRLSKVVNRGMTWSGTSDGYRIGIDGWAAMRDPGGDPPTRLSGWAADVEAGAVWAHVLLVDGDRVVSDGFTRRKRPDVADLHGEATLESGFFVDLAPALRQRVTELRVVVLFDDGGLLIVNGQVAPASTEPEYELVFAGAGRLPEVRRDGQTWSGTSPGGKIGIGGWAELLEPGAAPPASLAGWAADIETGAVWEAVLLVDGDQVTNLRPDRLERNDVAALYGERTLESGFFVEFDPPLAKRITELRIVVLFADGGLLVIN